MASSLPIPRALRKQFGLLDTAQTIYPGFTLGVILRAERFNSSKPRFKFTHHHFGVNSYWGVTLTAPSGNAFLIGLYYSQADAEYVAASLEMMRT